jgi:cytochrome c oxidase assembly protein subunit 15
VAQKGAEPALKRPIIALAFTSIGMVYTVMLMGVFLSSGPITEKGLVCTDWPLCPNGFGMPEERYMFEYVHRLFAALTTTVVYATAAIVPARVKRAKMASLVAAGLVSIQLLIGYMTVATHLHPLVVATHLSTGITVFAFALLTFLWVGVWRKR